MAIKSILNIYIFVILTTTSHCLRYKPPELTPHIRINSWIEAGEMNWRTLDDGEEISTDLFSVINGSTLVISPYVGSLILTCEANYPIQWKSTVTSHFPPRGMYAMRGRYSRETSDDIFDQSSFTFAADLQFQGEISEFTGNYTCEKVGAEELSSSIYMFWEGSSPPYLILSGKTIKLEVKGDEESLEIPCYTSVPDPEISLFKSAPDLFYVDHFEKLELSSSIRYDAKIGFIISSKDKNSPFPYGKYKCVMNDTSDFVVIQVIKKEPGKTLGEHVDVLQPHALASFDNATKSIMCCSSGRTPPALRIQLCRDPIVCLFFKETLLRNTDPGNVLMPGGHQLGNTWQEGSCSYSKTFPGLMGYFQCVGDGIDVIKNIYTSYPTVNGSYNYYSAWDDINPADLILITANENQNYFQYPHRRRGNRGRQSSKPNFETQFHSRNRGDFSHAIRISQFNKIPETIYGGESINFTCRASRMYFARGVKFIVEWKNHTLETIPPNPNNVLSQMMKVSPLSNRGKQITVTIKTSTEMAGISCYAPVYNSTKWTRKEITLNVQSPVLPSLQFGTDNEIQYWTLNETERVISCVAKGQPSPTVMLLLNDKEIVNGSSMEVVSVNSTIEARIHLVSHESHGDYTCVAYNLAGVTQKKITVIVEEPTHWASTIAVFITVAILLAALVFIGWKLNLKTKLLARLRRNTPTA